MTMTGTAASTRWEFFEAGDRSALAYVCEPAPLSAAAGLQAGRSADRLRRLLAYLRDRDAELVEVAIPTEVDPERLAVPLVALGIFADVLDDMAEGRVVAAVPFDTPLGPEEAARQLGVSRTWIARLGDNDELPCRRDGTKRRFRIGDVSAYRRLTARKRLPPRADWDFLDDESDPA